MSSNKKIIVGAAAAVAAVGLVTAVVALKNRKTVEDIDDEDAFVPSPLAPKVTEIPKATPAAAAPAGDNTAPVAASRAVDADSLLDEALEEVSQPASSAKAPASTAAAATQDTPVVKAAPVTTAATTSAAATTVVPGDSTVLAHLGVAIKAPRNWEVREELSPVPNMAMVTLWNPAFSEIPNAEIPGVVPVIIVSVEDVRAENLNLIEFKDRSKELSMAQMQMMANGIPPTVRKDAEMKVGPFRHIVEYSQSLPPFFDIAVINLLEVRNGVAYVLQIMANTKMLNEYRATFMQIASDLVITGVDAAIGYTTLKTGRVEIQADTTWTWDYSQDASAIELAQFELPSTVKNEKMTLYAAKDVPENPHAKRSEKVVDGVNVVSTFDGSHEIKTFTYGDYAIVVKPFHKAISFLPETIVAAVLKTAKPCSEGPEKKSAVFVCKDYGFSFSTVNGGRVIASKLGKGTVVYAPLGIVEDMSKSITITIRVGNPENDPDCESSIEAWKTRMENETEANISGIKIVTLKGMKCLTFYSKEMQETGPGQSTEVKGTVHIFVRNGETTLIRWESESGASRRYERDMTAFLESFTFIDKE